MHRLGQKVILVGDKFEQDLPIGEYGYIIAYDRNPDNAFDYVVRVPALNRNILVPKDDVELESTLLEREAERVQKEALIDYALKTKNKEMFDRLMNGDQSEKKEEKQKESISAADFVKQVNLRAWI
jgi:hypothetical protein